MISFESFSIEKPGFGADEALFLMADGVMEMNGVDDDMIDIDGKDGLMMRKIGGAKK